MRTFEEYTVVSSLVELSIVVRVGVYKTEMSMCLCVLLRCEPPFPPSLFAWESTTSCPRRHAYICINTATAQYNTVHAFPSLLCQSLCFVEHHCCVLCPSMDHEDSSLPCSFRRRDDRVVRHCRFSDRWFIPVSVLCFRCDV